MIVRDNFLLISVITFCDNFGGLKFAKLSKLG